MAEAARALQAPASRDPQPDALVDGGFRRHAPLERAALVPLEVRARHRAELSLLLQLAVTGAQQPHGLVSHARYPVRVLQHGYRRLDDGLAAVALRARTRHERCLGRVRAYGQPESRRHAELAFVRAEQPTDDGLRREGGRRQRPEQGRAVGTRGAAQEAAVVTCARNVHWLGWPRWR